MNIRSNFLTYFAVLSVLSLFACVSRKDIESLKKENDELKSQIARVELNTLNTPSPIIYEVFDVGRGKRVGLLTSDVNITVGERIFLNDDIWDVKFVKIFTNPTTNANDGTPQFHNSSIQLLVTFGGKGTDSAKK